MSNLVKQNSEANLIRLLQGNTVTELAKQSTEETKLLIYDLSVGLTVEKAMTSPKIFQLKKSLGMPTLIKLLCVIIRSFCDSIKASKTMDTVDIMECSELIIEKYSHDSVKDIILALKDAKTRGMNFYNSVSTAVIFDIITDYMDKKSSFIEKRGADDKSKFDGSVRTEAMTRVIEQEKRQQDFEKLQQNKQLEQLKTEKKELNNIKDFIERNINRID